MGRQIKFMDRFRNSIVQFGTIIAFPLEMTKDCDERKRSRISIGINASNLQ